MIELLDQELSKLQETTGNMSEWLQSLVSHYDSADEAINLIQTDFDKDGVSNKWVTVLYDTNRDKLSGEVEQRNAYGVVFVYRDSKFTLQSFPFSMANFGKAKVEAVNDLTGDGVSEVIWVSLNSGAHTTFSTYTVSTWLDGKLETFKGSAEIAEVSKVEIQNRKLLLTGGLIGSVGAGPWQREFTETYSIVNQTLKRTDRVFSNSPTPYHRLMDGLWAESHEHTERALRDYTEAIAMKSSSYKAYAFIFGGEWIEGSVKTDQEAEFERVVKRFSQLRKELLTKVWQGNDRKNACSSAKEKTGYEEAWLTYLNAPAGYANPRWEEDTVCSNVDELKQ